jgi:hypothetical protein
VPAVLVALLLLATGLVLGARRFAVDPLPWGADAPAYCRIAEAIVERGTLALPTPDRLDRRDPQLSTDTVWGTPYALTRSGRVFPKHPVAFALLLAPGWALGGAFGAFVASLLLSCLLAGLVTARAASRLGALPSALAALVLFFWVPAARTVALGINVDVALALAMVGAYALAADGRAALSGLVAGAALFLRPTSPLLFLGLPLVLGKERARWTRFALGLAPPLVLFAAANTALWGAPWRSAYERALVTTPRGLALTKVSSFFGGDALEGLRLLFLDARGGLLLAAPVMLLGLLGYALPEARRPEWTGASLGGAAALLSLAPYTFLSVVPAYNARFAFPLLVSAVPPLAALLARLIQGASARIRTR